VNAAATSTGNPDPGVTTLWRPCGPVELALVEQSGWRRWPPRLDWQPIFYPVLNETYAAEIARGFQVPASGVSTVTRFDVDAAYLARYDVQCVGDRSSLEYWIPAEELEDFNDHIVGTIQVVAVYRAGDPVRKLPPVNRVALRVTPLGWRFIVDTTEARSCGTLPRTRATDPVDEAVDEFTRMLRDHWGQAGSIPWDQRGPAWCEASLRSAE